MRPVCFCERSEAVQVIQQLKLHSSCDYYITANTTIADKRQKAYLLAYNNIVVDIDCHDAATPEDVRTISIETLINKIEGSDLPNPSIIHRTGRGVQFWFHIEQISAKLFFLYDKAVELLCSAFEYIIKENPTACGCLQVDRAASRNSVGLFRLFDTYNTKTGTRTTYTTAPNTYTIHGLIEAVQRSEDIPQTEPEREPAPVIHCIDCQYANLQRARMNVLEQLASEQTCEGMRELILFMYYNSAFQVCELQTAQALTGEINRKMRLPLPSNELAHVFDCVDKKHYKYKQKTFLEVLGITEEYFNKYSSQKKQEREKSKMDKLKKRSMAETLKRSGKYTNSDIAELTGYSLRTVERLEVERQSVENSRPWEVLGMSRATYYRHKKKQK